ncbi:MAG: peptidylprolyl isomerase [Saprospiraceae bacterium]|nr:peptidylprolyl isomerase [Saprospiraceae bacterium]
MTRRQLQWVCIGLLAAVAWGCVPADDHVTVPPFELDFRRADQQRLLDFQDRQLVDSLVQYFDHVDPSLRYRAAMAFASMRDSTVIHALGRLLTDPQEEVRMAAAYALGQSGSPAAEDILVRNFASNDSARQYLRSNAAILEAVGKTGSIGTLRYLATIQTYDLEDSILILGQARGIYRFALRGIVVPEGTAEMVDLLASTQLPMSIRVTAANYLYRARDIETAPHLPTLIPMFESDPDPRIRMCLAVALGKSADVQARRVLERRFSRDTDYRVQCNIIRALEYFPYNQVKELAFAGLQNANLHVARSAGQYLVNNGTRADALRYRAISKTQLPWEIKSLMYQASNKFLSPSYTITKTNINNELQEWLRRSKNPYESASVIAALAADPTNYTALYQRGMQADHPAERTAAIAAIGEIGTRDDLNLYFGGQTSRVRQQIAGYLADAVETGDVAMTAVAAGYLRNDALQRAATAYLSTLEAALDKITLPDAIETYNALSACIAELKGEEAQPKQVGFNHPIDWSIAGDLRDTIEAEVITSQGTVRLALFTEHAPGTVVNFVRLARDRFFHGKNFHRVVPNFVIQGGCPRGDGYGSLDYTIRSELAPAYYDREGYVGMASAGNHTECTQWFVTHSPTPHLDGNYTIFGSVTGGMDVVHNIQIGDEIREVNILN